SPPCAYTGLGSAGFAARLKSSLEESVAVIAQVPHGVSSHQLYVVSQKDVQRVVEKVVAEYPGSTPIHDSSVMIRSTVDEAKASGQVFGNVAFLTLTLSPTDMEDLPSEVSREIEREAQSRCLTAIIADAHN